MGASGTELGADTDSACVVTISKCCLPRDICQNFSANFKTMPHQITKAFAIGEGTFNMSFLFDMLSIKIHKGQL